MSFIPGIRVRLGASIEHLPVPSASGGGAENDMRTCRWLRHRATTGSHRQRYSENKRVGTTPVAVAGGTGRVFKAFSGRPTRSAGHIIRIKS